VEFSYEAVTSDGRTIRGETRADSERDLLRQLESQDLVPVRVKLLSDSAGSWRGRRLRRGVTEVERAQLVRELGTLLAAGVPLAEAVSAAAEGRPATEIGRCLDSVHAQLRAGAPFSAALDGSGLGLPTYLAQLVTAGEVSGKLAQALHAGADQMEYDHRVRREMRNALIYPSILVASGVGATLLIFLVVVPRFANILNNPRARLPDISVWVLKAGLFVKENLPWLGMGLAALIVGLMILAATPAARLALREAASRLPVVGEWLRQAELGRWATMLGTMLGNRVPIVKAMDLASASVSTRALSARLQLALRDVRAGRSLADSLAAYRTVNPVGINLVRVGERSGELPEMLRTLGRTYDADARDRMKRALILFEPMAILVVGAAIGFIMVAIMLAITGLSTTSL
jgi:general secretion pathway protein F